ncbi:MAG: hypothetical protein WBA74_18785, partial [Cyclobacteriaceae bacterium]
MNCKISKFSSIDYYEFSLESPTILLGKSGSGKSTIIQAIIWCFIGGRGHKHAKVDIDYNDVKYSRHNNHLTIQTEDKILKNSEAESYISSIYGSKESFLLSFCLRQSEHSLLCIGSGNEKWKVLNELTFGSQNPEILLEKCSSKISKYKSELAIEKSKIDSLKSVSEDIPNISEEDINNNLNEIDLKLELNNKELKNTLKTESVLSSIPEERTISDRIEHLELSNLLNKLKIKDIEKCKEILDKCCGMD